LDLGLIGTNFGLRVRLMDLINCAKFYRNRLRGFDSVRVEVWPFPLDCDIAVNTGGWPYTCDTNANATIGKNENAEYGCTSIIIWRCSFFSG